MYDINICRICLNKDTKLFHLDQFDLRYFYEQIMNIKIQKDNLPYWFCYECAALLHKYHKFKENCKYGQTTLKNLLSKGERYVTYEIIGDIRKNHINHSSLDFIIPSKLVKTYHVKYKPKLKQSQIENVIVTDFPEYLKYIPEAEDDTPLNKFCNFNLKPESKEVTPEPDFDINYDDDNYDEITPDTTDLTKIENELDLDIDFKREDTDIKVDDLSTLISKKIENTDEIPDSTELEHPLLTKRRSKKNEENQRSKKNENQEKLRKFEKTKKSRLSNENWEIKILSEDEALEQFRQRSNNSKYIKFNYKCEKCLKGFSRNDILLRHNKQCHDKGSFECRFCHMVFKRKFQLSRHMVVHYYVYQCLRCDLKCNLLSTAAFHEDSHNGVTRTCKLCGEQFKHVSTYYTHLRMSHRNSHICKLCGASFVSETGLEFHMKRQHCTDEITEQPNANIYCDKCDVSFVSQSAFDEHLSQSKLHEDEQPRKKRSRKEAIEKATTCRFCKERFTTRAECRAHVAAQHRGAKAGLAPDRVMCEICGAWLASSSIEVHMNRHTKKVVFPCQYCGKEFLCKSGYNTHQAKHTGIRPHACKICHKRFSQKFSMDIHYRRVHLKEPYPKRNRKKNTDEVPLFEKMKWT